jgi:hypothetical protein
MNWVESSILLGTWLEDSSLSSIGFAVNVFAYFGRGGLGTVNSWSDQPLGK